MRFEQCDQAGVFGLQRCQFTAMRWNSCSMIAPTPLLDWRDSAECADLYNIDSPSDLPADALELLHKCGDFLEHALLFSQVLRIERTHFGQNGIQLRATVAGKFTLQ